ncbi:MAG: hypothetical protein LBK58_13660 [Prevotellaceae bacterium]|jgi:hypothetical protein|nr:hypothetical protein [Prevotellaceae bacterium]
MKRIFVFMMTAIVAATSMSALMADPAMNNAQSSTFMVDDPNGTYRGTCYNVDMNGDTNIPPVDNVDFVVKSVGGNIYRIDGDVYIEVDVPIGYVEHLIHFNDMQFNVNPSDDSITFISGNGSVDVWIDGLHIGQFAFSVDTFTGSASGDDLDFHFKAIIPLVFDIVNFEASFDYSGTKI